MTDFRHLLLTRFNVRHAPWQQDKRGSPVLTDDWMEHRFGLFERFCLPSVRAQTCQDFEWLVFFDEATAARHRRRLDRYRDFAPFRPEFVADTALIETVRARAADAPFLITTRLDNDDAIHREAIARVQAHLPVPELTLVNFLTGYYLTGDVLYRVEHPSNMFISMLEPRGPAPYRSVWCAEHAKLGALGEIRQVTGLPGWLSVIHERNLSNQLDPREASPGFGIRSRLRGLQRALGLAAEPPATAAAPRRTPTRLRLAEIASDFGIAP